MGRHCGSLVWLCCDFFSFGLLVAYCVRGLLWDEIDDFLLLCEIWVWIDSQVCLIGILFFYFVCV